MCVFGDVEGVRGEREEEKVMEDEEAMEEEKEEEAVAAWGRSNEAVNEQGRECTIVHSTYSPQRVFPHLTSSTPFRQASPLFSRPFPPDANQ